MILEKVIAMLADQLGVDPDTINEETDIVNDLGADSLDVVTMLMCVEDEYGITISDEEAQDLRRVGDIVSYIERNM